MKKSKLSGKGLTFVSILEPIGVVTKGLSRDEEESFMQQWRESFSRKLKQQTGNWTSGGIDWNTFAGKFTPHVEGKTAIEQFDQLFVKEYTIIAGDNLSLRCQGRSLPSYSDFIKVINSRYYEFDTYISHINFNWTFVITHDKFIGPFFAKRKAH